MKNNSLKVHSLLTLSLLGNFAFIGQIKAEDAAVKKADSLVIHAPIDSNSDTESKPVSDIGNNTAISHNEIGLQYMQNRRYDQAMAEFDQAITLDSRCADAYNNRGLARYAEGDYVGAIADYDQALQIEPAKAESYRNRGLARYCQLEYKLASKDYDKAIAIDDKDYLAYIQRAVLLSKTGNYKGAMDDCDKALSLRPKSSQASSLRAQMRVKLDKIENQKEVARENAKESGKDFISSHAPADNADNKTF